MTRLPGRRRRLWRAWRGRFLSIAAGVATVAWVAWLVNLPTAAREGASSSVTAAAATVGSPGDESAGGEVFGAVVPPADPDAPAANPVPPDDTVAREAPLRGTVGTADVVVALAGVLALSESEAKAWADANGYSWRVTWRDGEAFAHSFDYVPERLNLEISAGVVVFAWFG